MRGWRRDPLRPEEREFVERERAPARPVIQELTSEEANGLIQDLAALFKTAGTAVAREELAFIAVAALTPRLLSMLALEEYEAVLLSCDCGGSIVMHLGYPIANRAQIITFLLDHGHAPHKRGIAARRKR